MKKNLNLSVILIALATILGWPNHANAAAASTTILPPEEQFPAGLALERGIMPMLKLNAVLDGADGATINLTLQINDNSVISSSLPVSSFVQVFRGKGDASVIPSYYVPFSGTGYDQFGISGPIHLSRGTNEIVFSGEMPNDLGLYAGAMFSLSAVGVNINSALTPLSDSVALAGNFPVRGPYLTINASLNIGSFNLAISDMESWNIVAGGSRQVIGIFGTIVSDIEACTTAMNGYIRVESQGNNVFHINNCVLVDDRGSIVAGPADVNIGESEESPFGFVYFPNAITFPKGGGRYYLKADIGSGFANGSTISVSTVPSDWWLVGQLYGYGFRGTTTATVSGGIAKVSIDSRSLPTITHFLLIQEGAEPTGQFEIEGMSPGGAYQLEQSPDLKSWQFFWAFTAGTNGALTINVPVVREPHWFFRVAQRKQ